MVQGDHHRWLFHLTRAYLLDDTGHAVEAGRVFKAGCVHDCELCFGNCALGRPWLAGCELPSLLAVRR